MSDALQPPRYRGGSTDPYKPCPAPDRNVCTSLWDKDQRTLTCDCPWTPDGPTHYPSQDQT